MELSDAYLVLGIPIGADRQRATEAKRDLLRLLHPDRHSNADERLRLKAEEKTREVNAAFETLERARFPRTNDEILAALDRQHPRRSKPSRRPRTDENTTAPPPAPARRRGGEPPPSNGRWATTERPQAASNLYCSSCASPVPALATSCDACGHRIAASRAAVQPASRLDDALDKLVTVVTTIIGWAIAISVLVAVRSCR